MPGFYFRVSTNSTNRNQQKNSKPRKIFFSFLMPFLLACLGGLIYGLITQAFPPLEIFLPTLLGVPSVSTLITCCCVGGCKNKEDERNSFSTDESFIIFKPEHDDEHKLHERVLSIHDSRERYRESHFPIVPKEKTPPSGSSDDSPSSKEDSPNSDSILAEKPIADESQNSRAIFKI